MEPIPSSYRLLRLVESESMRQIIDLPTTLGHVNASTCGFFASKGQCGRRLRNLPHTSVFGSSEVQGKFVICRPDSGFAFSRPAVLLAKTGCGRRCLIFPALPGNGRYGSGVRGEEWCARQEKSTEEKAIQWPTAVLGSVVGVTAAASLYRMRSARHNSPFGIFERRL